MFCQDRDNQLLKYNRFQRIDNPELEEHLICYKFLDFITNKIEIKRDDGKLELIYFRVLPRSFFLSKENKLDFINNVDRSRAGIKFIFILFHN